jgi:hypothetical protein
MLGVRRTIGHSEVKTAMIYADLLNKGGHGVRSPAAGWRPVYTDCIDRR